MTTKFRSFFFALVVAGLSILDSPLSRVLAQGTAFTYEGQLNNSGSPANGVYNLTFSLYDANRSGDLIAEPVTTNGVTVSNGLFTVIIDFGTGAFTGGTNWLEIEVQTNGAGSFTTLTPRQQMTPAPYAIFANTASNLLGTLPAGQLSGAIPLGVLPGFQSSASYNSVGGGQNNSANGTWVTIAGGNNNTNTGDASTISGGQNNTITYGYQPAVGGGYGNIATGNYATIPGGINNVATGVAATASGFENQALVGGAVVAGGGNNIASGPNSSVAGGAHNQAGGTGATVGGGYNNTNTANYAAIPGGYQNLATGTYAFAAGQLARATNQGAFVWADSQAATFSSTNNNSFNVRAGGGVNFVTGGAGLNVDGKPVVGGAITLAQLPSAVLTNNDKTSVTLTGTFSGNGNSLTSLNANNITAGTLSDSRLSANVPLLNGKQTFTGADTFGQTVNLSSNIYLNDNPMYLRNDQNHGLAYNGGGITNFPTLDVQPDGPVLWGFSGGALAVLNGGPQAALSWDNATVNVNNSLNVGGDATVNGTLTDNNFLQVNGDASVAGNLTVNNISVGNITGNNTPGVNYSQANLLGSGNYINVPNNGLAPLNSGNGVQLDACSNLKPAPGFFVIMASVWVDDAGNDMALVLFDSTSSPPVPLMEVNLLGGTPGLIPGQSGDDASLSLTWVVPITAAGGYENFATVVSSSGSDSSVYTHNLTVMYFPRQNN